MTWLKRSYKRDWLQRAPSLNSIAHKHELWNRTIWEPKPECMDKDPAKLVRSDYMPVEQINTRTEIIFSIGSNIVIIHDNENQTVAEGLKEYVRKLELLKEVINGFVRDYPRHLDAMTPFTVKKFLNPDTGPCAMYTSTVALSITDSHGFFFEIASCDDKARAYLKDEKELLEVTTKIIRVLSTSITEVKTTLETYKGRI